MKTNCFWCEKAMRCNPTKKNSCQKTIEINDSTISQYAKQMIPQLEIRDFMVMASHRGEKIIRKKHWAEAIFPLIAKLPSK